MNVTKKNTTYCYSIEEIASWQQDILDNNHLSPKDFEISLPSLQRGFVWKPKQIEALWDSILRGYPVGAVLMSQSGNKKNLLDGQQRSTSIALGFINPFTPSTTQEIFNLKKNIPVVWLDMKPIINSIYGLKFGVRVLTRSHPWGYQLTDHSKPLSVGERVKALDFFRNMDKNISFSELSVKSISPWDAHYPVPLAILLTTYTPDFQIWKSTIQQEFIYNLKDIKTKYSLGLPVNYAELSDEDLENIHTAIGRAKSLLIPEILVQKESLEEDDTQEESEDATLFVRLNTEGTRISGEELIYSLLKASFPDAKELVEKIDIKYIKPSKIVNLFARLSNIEASGFTKYQNEMNVTLFRKNIRDPHFECIFKGYIINSENNVSKAKLLIDEAISIYSLNKDIPNIYIKEALGRSTDLLLVLMIYLVQNQELSESDKMTIHKDVHRLIIFNSDLNKTALKLFEILREQSFLNWPTALKKLYDLHFELAFPMVTPEKFEYFINNHLINEYLKNGCTHFAHFEFIKKIISSNINEFNFLLKPFNREEASTEEASSNEQLHADATRYWKNLSETIYRNRNLLVLVQRDYFNREFLEFMEFEGIQDTNKPWDWDHIYPNSWVHSKKGISPIVRWLMDTNGNIRALSFNENRSQSNHKSPEDRFKNESKVQADSFIKKTDLEYWEQLTNDDRRLQEDGKVELFVKAVFSRMINIYKEVHDLFS